MRGNKQLKSASSAHVKGRAAELTAGKEMDKRFVQLTRKDGPIHKLMKTWEAHQEAMKKKGLDAKADINVATDRQRNADLCELTKVGGPFTSAEAVDDYLEKADVSDKDKNRRLYLEVRHAKNSSVCFLKASDIFRLKKGGTNMDTHTYGQNMMAYLRRITCHVGMDYGDFKDALYKLYT